MGVTAAHPSETLLFTVLLQLAIMIGAARLCHVLARRFGQPGVIGEILAGLLLGPSLFGHLFPQLSAQLFEAPARVPIAMISQIGLILLMFQIGSDFEFSRLSARRSRFMALLTALFSVALPLCLGLWLGRTSAASLAPGIDPVAYSLFCAVAMAITAVPILGRMLHGFGLANETIGIVAISAAALNDVAGWLLLGGISAYASGGVSASALLARGVELAALAALLWFGLRPLVKRGLARFPLDAEGDIPPNLLALVLCLMLGLAICTWSIGIFSIFGGFAAGLLFHRHIAFVSAWRRQVGRFVLVFFLPVFFTATGLRTNLLGLNSVSDLEWLALVLACAVSGKLLAAYVAGRLCGFDANQSMILGALMNTRGLMELVVLDIGHDLGVLPQKMFTMLVIMAVVTTMMTGPLLRILLARIGHVAPLQVEA